MMDAVFLKIVNMSVAASWLILAVIVLRLALRKAPRSLVCLLWLLVAVRLICPFSPEAPFSLIPSAETIPPAILYQQPPQTLTPATLEVAVNPILSAPYTPVIEASRDRVQTLSVLGSLLWLAGLAAMLAYALVSYLRLRRRVDTAVRRQDNIWQSEAVGSPFVLGVVRPRVYLPFQLSGEEAAHIIAHEQAHIARRDHLWKPLGFVILAVYWFNPLVWLAYVLLCRDLELACDQRVIREFDREQRADYSAVLLSHSLSQKKIALCPLAFGGVGVKERVDKVLNYKKPALWLAAVAVVAIAVTAACFLTDPQDVAQQEDASQTPTAVLDSAEAHVQAQMLMGGQDGAAVWQDWRITKLERVHAYQLDGRMYDLYRLDYERQAQDLELVQPMVLAGALVSEDNWVSNSVSYYLLYDAKQEQVFGQPLAVHAPPGSRRFRDDLNNFLPYWQEQQAAQDHLLAAES